MNNKQELINIFSIKENIENNIKIIANIKLHLKKLQTDNIIANNKYNNLVDKIKFMNSELFDQLKCINTINDMDGFDENELIIAKIKHIVNNFNTIKDETNKLIFEFGYISIINSLQIINYDLYIKYNFELNNKLNFINEFFQITNIESSNETSNETSNKMSDEMSDEIISTNNLPLPVENNFNIRIQNLVPNLLDNNNKNSHNNHSHSHFFGFNDEIVKNNLIYELNKALIELTIDKSMFVFRGYFKEDVFNEVYLHPSFEKKYLEIKNKLLKSNNIGNVEQTKMTIFFNEFMTQLSIKEYITIEPEFIVGKINTMYNYLNKIDKLSIIDLLEEFIQNDPYTKRNIILLLLFSDVELLNNKINTDYEDILNIKNNLKNTSSETPTNIPETSANTFETSDNISNSENNQTKSINTIKIRKRYLSENSPLPLVKLNKTTAMRYSINSIMKHFDTKTELNNLSSILINSKKILNANMLMDYLKNSILGALEYDNFLNSIHWNFRKKIFAKSSFDTNTKEPELSWEDKLNLCDISNKAKDKVIEKIKEVKGSKDNVKAETFIESFFKIPFGKYIKEDIFIKSTNADKTIKNLINKINSIIIIPEDALSISDSIEQIKMKSLPYRMISDIENNIADIGFEGENENINELVDELIYQKTNIIDIKNEYLEKVDTILEDAIYGHKESKREIKRLIAQWMGGKMEGVILGFYGPPGVGKTCFAKKGISKCLFDKDKNPRPMCIFQLGGATDGSILEGHSYTYVGAKPGRLVEFLQETKCMNPILYFDELDKVSDSDKGREIIDILIHLTDKSQNSCLFDKYFSGIELDFSKCIIIFSYNDASKVNRILRDRITEIKINPLKKNAKVVITKKYTLKEISEELNYDCKLSDELIEYIIDTYTLEPGIRKLNEKLYEIFREINLRVLENPHNILFSSANFIDKDLIDEILTRHYKIKPYLIHNSPKVGLVNGLYASTIGLGGITLIQIIKSLTTQNNMPLELTGQQGDVMKESMSCAKTVALNLLTREEKDFIYSELKNNPFGLHIHCPDGATPKDGPSAGITITTGIYSVLTNKPIRNDIAMTGEIDLLGNVKAIGGLDAKINGAIKAGVKLVIFPKENEQDFEKILKDKLLDAHIDYFMAETIQQVIDKAIIF